MRDAIGLNPPGMIATRKPTLKNRFYVSAAMQASPATILCTAYDEAPAGGTKKVLSVAIRPRSKYFLFCRYRLRVSLNQHPHRVFHERAEGVQ